MSRSIEDGRRPKAQATLAALLLLWGGVAAAQPVPWAKLRRARGLPRAKRAVAASAMRSLRCYYGCTDTIARCLRRRRTRATFIAWRLADYVAFLAGKGLDRRQIAKVLRFRRRSALPRKVHRIKPDGAPRLGKPKKAKVVIVEYIDYLCGHCSRLRPLLERLVRSFPGKVVVYIKPYPLRLGGPQMLAARAALAAQRQGKFHRMHALLFANRRLLDASGLAKLARHARIDGARLARDMSDRTLLRRLERYKIEGMRLGLKGTPALFFNGKRFRLRKDMLHLKERLIEELHMVGP